MAAGAAIPADNHVDKQLLEGDAKLGVLTRYERNAKDRCCARPVAPYLRR